MEALNTSLTIVLRAFVNRTLLSMNQTFLEKQMAKEISMIKALVFFFFFETVTFS
jgi:hypothetical protein